MKANNSSRLPALGFLSVRNVPYPPENKHPFSAIDMAQTGEGAFATFASKLFTCARHVDDPSTEQPVYCLKLHTTIH